MKMTNMDADILLQTYSKMKQSLANSVAPTIVVFGLQKNIRILQTELKDYLEFKGQLLDKYNITQDAQINNTPEGQSFLQEFTPLAQEIADVELHKINLTFDDMCDLMENCNAMIAGNVDALMYICKDESEVDTDNSKKESE